MDLLNLMKNRYSERRFNREKSVEPDKADLLIEAARLAPTAHNAQPFKLYILQGNSCDERLKQATQCNFGATLHFLFVAKDEEAWVRTSDQWNAADLDIGIASTQVVLLAEELGLASCYICAFDDAAMSEQFQLPENERPVLLLAIGYKSERSRPAGLHELRKSKEELVQYL